MCFIGYEVMEYALCDPINETLYQSLAEARKHCDSNTHCSMFFSDGNENRKSFHCYHGAKIINSFKGNALYIKGSVN